MTALAIGDLPQVKPECRMPVRPKLDPADSSSKIDALTSLRFIAASMIVLLHSSSYFSLFPPGTFDRYPIAEGVSFFFVLSGFILAYNYPELKTRRATVEFLRSRFARIWPAHAFAALICVVLALPTDKTVLRFLIPNLLMIHSWFPQGRINFAINPPSWSISTEFAFYLLFPLLILNFKNTWHWKLALTAISLGTLLVYCALTNAPVCNVPNHPTVQSLIYVNPLARLFEFAVGMCASLVFARIKKAPLNSVVATALEIGAVALVIAYFNSVFDLCQLFRAAPLGAGINLWLVSSGNAFGFAALIVACALNKGLIAKGLSNSFFVWLGEISYSIYLLHDIVLAALGKVYPLLPPMPLVLCFAIYCLTVIALAHCTYKCVETPMRRWIRGTFQLPFRQR